MKFAFFKKILFNEFAYLFHSLKIMFENSTKFRMTHLKNLCRLKRYKDYIFFVAASAIFDLEFTLNTRLSFINPIKPRLFRVRVDLGVIRFRRKK